MVLSLELATGYCICFESSLNFEFFICILHLWFAIASNTCFCICIGSISSLADPQMGVWGVVRLRDKLPVGRRQGQNRQGFLCLSFAFVFAFFFYICVTSIY